QHRRGELAGRVVHVALRWPNFAPSPLAGEGPPLMRRPSADAVAGNGWDGGRVEGEETLHSKRRRLSRLRRLPFQIRRIPKWIRPPKSPQQLGHIRATVAPGV